MFHISIIVFEAHYVSTSFKLVVMKMAMWWPGVKTFFRSISSFPYRETHGRKQTLKHENEATNVHSYYFGGGYAWKILILINFASLLLFCWI